MAAEPRTPASPFTAEAVERAWKEALSLWDVEVTLSPPEPLAARGKGDWGGREPLAYIDLATRQIVVNFAFLERIGAAESLPAVLAHELGHHVRFPHTLGLAASLQVLEQRLIPGLAGSLTNLFFDLQVNEVVGRTHADALCAVYRGFVAEQGAALSPLFWFYLTVYEELWGMERGSLAPAAQAEAMEKEFPGCRVEARLFAQTFYALDDVYLQFVYFCSRFIRYCPDPEKVDLRFPLANDLPSPDLDDYAGSLYGNEQVDRALDEAAERGWISEVRKRVAKGDQGDDPLTLIGRLAKGRPGTEVKAFREALVAAHYKRLVERHLIEIPRAREPEPEPFLPTVAEEWEWGENPRSIDWTLSVLASGPLAAAHPLRRELEPDKDPSGGGTLPAVEIYLDTSGSMPSPDQQINAMTLAAQVLAASAIRRKGMVRGVIYSSDYILSDWMYDEDAARRFLLNYSGGGTAFPFVLLERLSEERPGAIRVVISDSDFLYNCQQEGAMERLLRGTERSRRFVALLSLHPAFMDKVREVLGPALRLPGFALVTVDDLKGFGKAASDLARALFGR